MIASPSTEVCKELPAEVESQNASPTKAPSSRSRLNVPFVVLGVVIAFYLVLSLRLLRADMSGTGSMVYPLDDTYITMAMAKNLALHGVAGVSAGRFVSASSCPGFLLLVAAVYFLTGPSVWCPMALSLTFGLLAIVMAQRLLAGTHWGVQLSALLAIVYFTPLHVMGLLGMEHSLHLLLVLAFLHLVATLLAQQKTPGWGLLLLTAFMVSVRYESLFLVAVACILFGLQGRILAGVRLGMAAAAPVAMYGAVALLNESYWLPQSIALKGLSPSSVMRVPAALAGRILFNLRESSHVGWLFGLIVVLLATPSVLADKRARAILLMVFGAIPLHYALASTGWVYRYEAYLVGAAIAAIACTVPCISISRNRWSVAASLIFVVAGTWALTERTVDAEMTFPWRCEAVYSQQIQMARFLSQFEPGVSVAANDIGAINYFADIDCTDLTGLGDREIFWLKKKGMYTTETMARLAADRKVKIAIVYDSWFASDGKGGPPLPASWIRVERWQTPYGWFLGDGMVSFYAADPAEALRLKSSLDLFIPSLPKLDLVLEK